MKPAMKKVLRAALAALALPILLPVLLLVQSTAYALPPPCDPNDPDATQTITITSPANNTVFASGTTPITVNYTYTSTGVVGYTGSTWSLYTNGTLTQSGSLANTATSVSFANLGTANYGVTIAPKHGIMGEGCVVDQTSGGVSFSVASPVPPNAAQFISQSVPASMVAGQVYPVSVSMKNTGTNTWTSGSAYSLGSQNPQDNSAWGTNRVAMPASTAPGSTATFSFNVTAPAFGSYNFQWQMVQDGVAWFGDYSPNAAVAVSKANQTISFAALAGKTYGDAPFAVSASATSGLAVTFSSTTPSVCTVSGSTVTIAATGTCTIAADQAGNANYNAAPQFPQSFTVGQGTQTIAGFAPATPIAYAPGGTFALTATGGASGNAVTFASTTPAICTVSGATATIVAVGSCTLTANQAGNANYTAAAQVTAGVAINKANQTIAFGALATRTVGDAPFALSATASSGLTVTFSSTTGTVCTVSGSTATLLTAGACTIAADQVGNANYNAAPQVGQSFTVNAPPIQVFYVHPDHLGTPRAITRASDNAKVWEWKNDDPFGNNPPNEDPASTGTAFKYNLRFPGQIADSETGTYQNYYRDYDPTTGRYPQSDPIGLYGGINTYAYVGGNPISQTDPRGLACNGKGCWPTDEERALAQAGNYSAYYALACAGGDPYACRAREVADNNGPGMRGLMSNITNARLKYSIEEKLPENCPDKDGEVEKKLKTIRIALAKAHVGALLSHGATPKNPVMLDRVGDIGAFHTKIFLDNGAGDIFGGATWDSISKWTLGTARSIYEWCPAPSCAP